MAASKNLLQNSTDVNIAYYDFLASADSDFLSDVIKNVRERSSLIFLILLIQFIVI